ncbi:MAG TPA: hypothetical protein VFV52_03600 [Bacilli bacterium]|nr:hypothetical protein [Bacilli bacterium]
MCYFIHAVTPATLQPDFIQQYLDLYDIELLDMTDVVIDRLPELNYYGILRGCSCDFVSQNPMKNNAKEIHDLIGHLAAQGDLLLSIVLDEGQFKDIGTDIQHAINRYLRLEMTLAEFRLQFPPSKPTNISYVIRQEPNTSSELD